MRTQPNMPTLRPDPIEGESRPGYLLRSLTINGRRLNRDTKRRYGLRMSAILSGADGDVVRRVTGVDLDIPDMHTVNGMTSRRVQLRGQVLHRDDFTTEIRRWCSACWSADLKRHRDDRRPLSWNLHRRSWWDVVAIETCPTHSVRLATRCPACENDVSWRTGTLTRCGCGKDLLGVEAEPVDATSTEADAYVLGRLGYAPHLHAPFLDCLDLGKALDAMQQLGATKLGGALGALSKFEPSRHSEVLSEGFRLARGWPNTFNTLLDGLAERAGLGHWGAEKLYGYLYIWVKALEGPYGDDARDRLAKHYASNSFVRKDSIIARLAEAERISLVDLMERTGRSAALVRSALDRFGFVPAATKRGTPIAITPPQAKMVEDFFHDSLEQKQLPMFLGLSFNSTKRLVTAGTLAKSDLRTDDVVKKNQFFSRKEIAAMMAETIGSAPALMSVPAGCSLLTKVTQTSGLGSIDDAIGLIRDGTLAIAGVLPARNLGAIVISVSAVEAARAVVFENAMTIEAAAEANDLHPGSLAAAIDAGLIAATAGHGGRPRVTQGALDHFRERYTTTGWLTAGSTSGHRWINAKLERAGIRPLLTPASDERSKTSIWDRSKLPPDLIAPGTADVRVPQTVRQAPDREAARDPQITDEEWEQVAPLIEAFAKAGGKKSHTSRRFIEAIRWLLRNRAYWRALPSEYGPWSTTYARHKSWLRSGLWVRLADALADDARYEWMKGVAVLFEKTR